MMSAPYAQLAASAKDPKLINHHGFGSGQSVESGAPIAYRCFQLLFSEFSAFSVLDRQPWRSADALDLAPRCQPPIFSAWPLEYTELQARGAGVEY
jgi:hypothetical protein